MIPDDPSTWTCPVHPEWCDNTGCEGEWCTDRHTAAVAGLLERNRAVETDGGVEFPAVSIARIVIDGEPGIVLNARQPHSVRRGAGEVSVCMLRSDAKKLLAALAEKIDLLDEEYPGDKR